MATITWHPVPPNKNVVRARIKGFVSAVGTDNLLLTGQILTFGSPSPIALISLKVRDEFFTPSSNIYSMDYIFDASGSSFTVFGSPINADIYVDTVYLPIEKQYRIAVFANVAPDPTQIADLAPLTGYWNPIL